MIFYILHIWMILVSFCPLFSAEEPQNDRCYLSVDEAVSLTLKYQRNIEIRNEEIEVQAGILRQRGSPFDIYTSGILTRTFSRGVQRTYPPDVRTRIRGYTTQVDSAVTRKNRCGTRYGFTTQLADIKTLNIPDVNPLLVDRTSFSRVVFRIDQPFLKGFLNGLERMAEEAQRAEVSAAWYTAANFVSQSITESVAQYWDVVAAKKFILVQEEAVQNFINLAERTQKLIQGDELAVSDLTPALAQLADARLNLVLAQQQYYTALQTLKFTIGIGDQCTGCDKDISTDNFPPIQEENLPANLPCEKMMQIIQLLMRNRWDVQAAKLHEVALSLLLKGSINEALPQLDVFGSIINQENNRILSPQFGINDTSQLDFSGGLVFSYPLFNDFALGLIRERKAELRQAQLITQRLKEQISVQFFEAWQNHIYLIAEIKEAATAVERFKKVVSDELKKLSEGYSNIFFVINYQNDLTNAQLREIDAYRRYAQNIVNFRFITGTLIKLNDNSSEFEIEPVVLWPKGIFCVAK